MAETVPTARQISWIATIPQFAALAMAVATGWLVTRSNIGMMVGVAIYLVYSFGSRHLIPFAHRKGVSLSQNQKFAESIVAHEASYNFFTRHPWLDRYRSIIMMSASAVSFREMALLNIAFAHSQIGNGEKAKEYYRRTLAEFPNSNMAIAALRMIDSVERTS
jgi:hypothetical protein